MQKLKESNKRGIYAVLSFLKRNIVVDIFIVHFVFFSIAIPWFLTFYNLMDVLSAASVVGVITLGLSIVIASGEFDMSMGGIAMLAGMFICGWLRDGHSLVVALLVTFLITGLGIGFVNGILVTKLGINSVVATIGMAFVAIGIMRIYSGGHPILRGFPPSFFFIYQGYIQSIPFPVIIWLFLFLVLWFTMSRTKRGRYIYAIGSSPETASLSGINVQLHKYLTFLVAGLLSSLGGIMRASQTSSAMIWSGWDIVLDSLMAAFVGIAIAGGRVFIPAVAIGALFLSILDNGLTSLEMPPCYQGIYKGGILLMALALGALRSRTSRSIFQ
jgi:ribose transport system permease protein